MAEEYRLSVGIDASAAAEGAAEFKGATLEIIRSSDKSVEHLFNVEEGFKKVTKAADGTVVVEYARTLDDFGKSAESVGGDFNTLTRNVKTATDALREAAAQTTNYSYEIRDALGNAVPPANLWDDATQALSKFNKQTVNLGKQADASSDAVQGITDGINAEVQALNEADATIRELAKGMAEIGKLDVAETLTQMADGFRDTYTNILKTRPELQELSKAFDELTEGSKTLDDMTSTFLDFSKQVVRARADLEAGVTSTEEYKEVMLGLEKQAVEAAAGLYNYRNALVEAAKANDENADAVERLLPVVDQMISGYGMAKEAIDEYKRAAETTTDTLADVGAATGNFSSELSQMAQDFADSGNAIQASRLFDLSDEFREMESHIAAALEPGSLLLQQFADSAGKTSDQMRELYTEFGTLIADVTEAKLAFEQGNLTVDEFRSTVEDLQTRIRDLTPELAEMRSQLQFETNAAEASKEVEDMLEKLGDAQKTTESFTAAQTEAANAGQDLNNAMTTMGVTAGRINTVFMRIIGVTGLGASLYMATKEASNFDSALVKLANTSSSTEADIDALKETMMELADQFGNRTVEEASGALAIMGRGYRDTAEAAKILTAANSLADATFGNVAASASALSQAMAAFEIDASDAADAASTLAVAAGGSAEAMQQMAFMAGRLGAMMAQAGVSLEDYAVAVSALRQSGMETRRAIMGLTQLVTSLTNLSTKAQLRFEELGISIDANRVAYEGLAPVLQEIYEKTDGNKAAMQRLLGSAQAATVVLAMMRNEGENYNKAMEAMANKTQRMQEMAERVNATFAKLSSDLKNRLLNKLAEFGDLLKGRLIPLLQTLNTHIDLVSSTFAAAFQVTGVVAALGIISKAFLSVRSSMIQTAAASELAKAAIGKNAAETAALVQASANTTVVALADARSKIVSVFSGLGKAIILGIIGIEIYKYFRDDLIKVFPYVEELEEIFKKAFRAILGALKFFVQAVIMGFTLLRDVLPSLIAEAIGDALGRIGSAIKDIPGLDTLGTRFETASGKIKASADATQTAWKDSMDAMGQDFKDYVNGTEEAATSTHSFAAAIQNLNVQASSTKQFLQDMAAEGRVTAKQLAEYADYLNERGGRGGQRGRPRPEAGVSENFRQEIEQSVSSDPYLGLEQKRREVLSRMEALRNITDLRVMDTKTKNEGLAALGRELEALNVQAAQLVTKRSPMEEYFRGIQAAADPAVAALYAYEDRVIALNQAKAAGMNTESYDRQMKAAAIAYTEAAKNAGLFVAELGAIETASNPAKVAMDAYADAVMVAVKALAAGADQDKVNEYLRQQAQGLSKSLALIELESDTIGALRERYDPLVKLERERKRAIAEIEGVVKSSRISEAEYNAEKQRTIDNINREYDARAKLLALQEDQLVQLAAKYDPLVANEVARTQALIEMEAALSKVSMGEQERVQTMQEFTRVINEHYDTEARRVTGSLNMADAWKEAWRSAIERVDSAFVELWKSAFKGADGFLDQLKDLAKQMVAEVAHAAITRPIIMSIAQKFSGEAKPGETFGGGIMSEVLGRLAGFQTGTGKPFETRPSAVETIKDGILAAFSGGLGGAGGGISGVFSKAFSDAFPKLGELFAPFTDAATYMAESVAMTAEEFASAADALTNPQNFLAMARSNVFGAASPAAVQLGASAEEAAAAGIAGQAGGGGGLGAGNLLSAIGKLSKTFATFSSAFGSSYMGYLQGGWLSSGQMGMIASSGAAGGPGVIAGQLAGAATYGLAAGYGTNLLLGQRGDPGRNLGMSAIGGIIGNFFLPGVGALLGGAIGSFVDNLIGGSEELRKFTTEIRINGGEIEGYTRTVIRHNDSWFRRHNETTLEDLPTSVMEGIVSGFHAVQNQLRDVAEALNVSTDAIDDFTLSLSINMRKMDEEEADAALRQEMMNAAGKQIVDFVNNTEGLSDRFKTLLQYFREYTEDFSADTHGNGFMSEEGLRIFATLLSNGLANLLRGMTGGEGGTGVAPGAHIDSTGDFSEEFFKVFEILSALEAGMITPASEGGQRIMDEGTKTMTEKYADLSEAAIEAAERFDGTIVSLEAVTAAYLTQKQAAFELAAALKAASTEISKMFADTADAIRMSLMSSEELYNYQRAQAHTLAALLSETTDPGELMRLSQQINSLVNTMYQGLDESQRTAMAPEFLTFLEGVNDVVQAQVTAGLTALDTADADVTEQVSEAMLRAVIDLSSSTSAYADAIGAFGVHVDAFGNYIGVLGDILEDFQGNYQPPPPNYGTSTAPPTPTSTHPTGMFAGVLATYLASRSSEVNA